MGGSSWLAIVLIQKAQIAFPDQKKDVLLIHWAA
jgi:hypothetical protein